MPIKYQPIDFKILKFDTDLMGFGVAKILTPCLNLAALQNVLKELQKQQVKLVYWPSDSLDESSQEAARQLQGHLCSKQVTYVIELKKLEFLSAPNVTEYVDSVVAKELEKLALYAGTYSHFVNDPKFPYAMFVKTYQNWIANSANKTLAKKILVIRYKQKIVGMVTLGEKNQRGDIGLLGIDENFRGKGFGKQLVQAAQMDFIKQGYATAQVVTQLDNVPACKLYEKCGYIIEKVENYYHFWLF